MRFALKEDRRFGRSHRIPDSFLRETIILQRGFIITVIRIRLKFCGIGKQWSIRRCIGSGNFVRRRFKSSIREMSDSLSRVWFWGIKQSCRWMWKMTFGKVDSFICWQFQVFVFYVGFFYSRRNGLKWGSVGIWVREKYIYYLCFYGMVCTWEWFAWLRGRNRKNCLIKGDTISQKSYSIWQKCII